VVGVTVATAVPVVVVAEPVVGGRRAQEGETVAVLVTVSLDVAGWQIEGCASELGAEQTPSASATENFEVWAWIM
jgi:hypothetical protein